MNMHDERHFPGEGDRPLLPMAVQLAGAQMQKGHQMSMPAIRTVKELVDALTSGPGPEGYIGILRRVDIPCEEFGDLCRWNDKHYTRTCIARTGDFELLLICYEPGQRTSIHDYDSEEAWVHPVQGSIVEERFHFSGNGQLELLQTSILDRGSFSHLAHGHNIHRYTNASLERSATLNLYAKPLLKWKVYEERA
jgi:cysteine dioxygenase